MTEALHLDHLFFVPDKYGNEQAFHADGDLAGEITFDEVWQRFEARKPIGCDVSPWRPMRCVHEARAFIVSQRRTQ